MESSEEPNDESEKFVHIIAMELDEALLLKKDGSFVGMFESFSDHDHDFGDCNEEPYKVREYRPEENLTKRGLDPGIVDEAFVDGFPRRKKDGANYEILGVTGDGDYLQIVYEEQKDF
jgi:hypothetical protein